MHPLFFYVDHKIGPDINHHGDTKFVPKRTQPMRLLLSPTAAGGWPPVPMYFPPVANADAIRVPSGQLANVQPVLRIMPPPRQTLRDMVGRFLIRAGQRMILNSRA